MAADERARRDVWKKGRRKWRDRNMKRTVVESWDSGYSNSRYSVWRIWRFGGAGEGILPW